MRKTFLYFLAATCLAAGCNKEIMSPRQGVLRLSVASEQECKESTKAGETVSTDNFKVHVWGTTYMSTSYAQDYLCHELNGGVSIPYGSYQLSVYNVTEAEAVEGFGCARYYGESTTFTINNELAVDVDVTCSLTNGKLKLIFDSSFLEDFSNPSVTFVHGQRQVTLDETQAAENELYFNVSEDSVIKYAVKATVKSTSKTFNYSSQVTLGPRKFAKITIRSNHNGVIGPDISVDDNMGSQGQTVIINPDEDPVVEEPEEGGLEKPSIQINTDISDAVLEDGSIEI